MKCIWGRIMEMIDNNTNLKNSHFLYKLLIFINGPKGDVWFSIRYQRCYIIGMKDSTKNWIIGALDVDIDTMTSRMDQKGLQVLFENLRECLGYWMNQSMIDSQKSEVFFVIFCDFILFS